MYTALPALRWWNEARTESGAFTRLTQMSVLRLLTTAAAMDGQPLTNARGLAGYDHLCEDDRVAPFPEPAGLEDSLRELTTSAASSPKVWTDAYLLAFATGYEGKVVTF